MASKGDEPRVSSLPCMVLPTGHPLEKIMNVPNFPESVQTQAWRGDWGRKESKKLNQFIEPLLVY